MSKKKFSEIIQKYYDSVDNTLQRDIALEIIERIDNDPDFFVRKKIDGKVDIGSSVLLCTPDYKKILFLDHIKLKNWTLPGGHADGEIDLYKAALNELREEVGIDIPYDIHHDISPLLLFKFNFTKEIFGYAKSIITLFYVVICPVDQTPQNMEPHKCTEIRWMDIDQVREIAILDTSKCIDSIIDVWQELTK